jgi:hypothetical protein
LRQIQENRTIYFLEEDTQDDVQDADEDIPIVEDLGRNQRLAARAPPKQKQKLPASNRGFVERDNEIADIYEERQRLMKQEVRNFAKINPRPAPAQQPSTDDPNLEAEEPQEEHVRQAERSPMEEAMEADEDLPQSKPLLIPNAKNRIKLQPIHLNPV